MSTLGQVFLALVLIAVILALSSYGDSALNPISLPSVQAAAPDFPPATPLTCTGAATDATRMICDESDGHSLYQHYHWTVALRQGAGGNGRNGDLKRHLGGRPAHIAVNIIVAGLLTAGLVLFRLVKTASM